MAEFRINVVIDPARATTGIDQVDSRLNRTERNARRLQGTLARAFTLVGVLAAAREIGVLADSITNAQNRIRIVTDGTAQLNAVMSELFDIAARTRTGFDATATIFSRTALAVRDLGLSQQQTLNFTESLNQAIVLSGVRAQEANAGLIQLSQGLASGTLRGDELRSVLEQLPRVADVIADSLGVTRGELRLLGQEGRISAEEVITAFEEASDVLANEFAGTVPTISQAFSVLVTNITRFIGEINASTNASENLARAIIFLSENLDTVASIAVVAGAALAGPFARAGVLFATRAVTALTLAIAANPIGALVVVLLAGAAAVREFGDQLIVSADGMLTLRDVATATFDFLVSAVQPVVDTLTEGFEIAVNFIINAFTSLNVTFSNVITFASLFINNFIGLFVGLGRAVRSIFSDLREIIISVIGQGLIADLGRAIDSIFDFVVEGFGVIQTFANGILDSLGLIAQTVSTTLSDLELPEVDASFAGNLVRVGQNARDAFLTGFDQDFVGDLVNIVAPALTTIEANARQISSTRRAETSPVAPDGGLDDVPDRTDRIPFALQEQLRLLDEEARILQLTNRERGIQNELLDIEEGLRSSNVSLNDGERALLLSRIENITAVREQVEILDDLRGPQEELVNRQAALNELYAAGSISLAELNNEMLNLALAQSELNIEQGQGTFFDGFLIGIENMLESVRNFSAEAGSEFASFFEGTTQGFAEAAANSLVFGESFSDAIGGAARSALADLLAGLIRLGLQFALNAALGNALAATSTAAGVAQAATLTAAFTPAATFVSLATSGANAVGANAGIASTAALTASLSVAGFADGGFVSGAGGPRSDSIPAMLSDGEFVVNARSTARFRPQLEAMNRQAASSGGSSIPQAAPSDSSNSEGQGSNSGNNVSIINVFDPGLMEDYLTSASGERALVNVIERNSSSVNQVLRNS